MCLKPFFIGAKAGWSSDQFGINLQKFQGAREGLSVMDSGKDDESAKRTQHQYAS